jgi:DNA polymerase (family 10)
VNNTEIAKVFEQIADLLELKGENVFKIRAYRRAAQTIEHLPEELKALLARGEDLRKIPGIGNAIAQKSKELIETEKLGALDELVASLPEGIMTLLSIPGVGPKTAYKLAKELEIKSPEELERAILEGKVSQLFRLGDKTAQNILHHIQAIRRKDVRIPLGKALPVVEEILGILRCVPGVRNLTAAGSLRRFKETLGDIDIMGTADQPETVIEAFIRLSQVMEVLAHGPTKASVILPENLKADLRMVEHDAFGSLLQHFTGSREHNIALRTRAQRDGLSLSEYGITVEATGHLEKFATEEAFYRRLGLQYIPPEIREDQGEIELAAKGKLPSLIELSDIKGDFHVHSDWSDGHNTIEEMALAAQSLGYRYLAITDHTAGLGIARGLTGEKLEDQIRAIRKLNRKLDKIQILTGIEIDIRSDGRLDLPDAILSELDVVLASVHSSLNQSAEKMTNRIIRALENPHVDILAHPTGRLIGDREPSAVNMDAVFNAAKKFKKTIEINAMPNRLDLRDVHIRRAKEIGIPLAIGSDAHHVDQLGLVRFGVGMARRGWCEPKHIVNTLPLSKLVKHFSRNRS